MNDNEREEPFDAQAEEMLRTAFWQAAFPPTPALDGRVASIVRRHRLMAMAAKSVAAMAAALLLAAGILYWRSGAGKAPEVANHAADPPRVLRDSDPTLEPLPAVAFDESLAILTQPPVVSFDVLAKQQAAMFDILMGETP